MKTHPAAYRSAVGVAIATAVLLLIPLFAMQVTDEVVWSPTDFAVAGLLLLGTGLVFTVIARKGGGVAYRTAVGLALGASLFLVWANLAVGLIGSENDPANLMYFGVLGVGVLGAVLARLEAPGMARALFGMALAQAGVAVIALVLGLGSPSSGPGEILWTNGLFVALFVGSALLFRRADEGPRPAPGPRD